MSQKYNTKYEWQYGETTTDRHLDRFWTKNYDRGLAKKTKKEINFSSIMASPHDNFLSFKLFKKKRP